MPLVGDSNRSMIAYSVVPLFEGQEGVGISHKHGGVHGTHVMFPRAKLTADVHSTCTFNLFVSSSAGFTAAPTYRFVILEPEIRQSGQMPYYPFFINKVGNGRVASAKLAAGSAPPYYAVEVAQGMDASLVGAAYTMAAMLNDELVRS